MRCSSCKIFRVRAILIQAIRSYDAMIIGSKKKIYIAPSCSDHAKPNIMSDKVSSTKRNRFYDDTNLSAEKTTSCVLLQWYSLHRGKKNATQAPAGDKRLANFGSNPMNTYPEIHVVRVDACDSDGTPKLVTFFGAFVSVPVGAQVPQK